MIPSGVPLIRTRLTWDRGRSASAAVMADSGAAVTVVGPAIAGILREAGFTEHACSIPLQLAAGDEATTCSSFIIVKNATIETRYGEVRVPPHPVIVSNTLNIDGIVGLDMLTAAGVLVDPTLSSLWHIDHIHKSAGVEARG